MDTETTDTINTTNTLNEKRLHKGNIITGWAFLILGIIGVILSAILNTEKMRLLADSQHVLSCSFNEEFSCGNVMTSSQSEVFGFPNMIIGLVGFGIVAAIGAGILAGAQYKQWFWLATFSGMLFAVTFSLWLMYSAVYIIGYLCIYCMGVWAVSIFLFTNTLSHIFLNFAPQDNKAIKAITTILYRHWFTIGFVWYAIILLLIYVEFR